VRMVELRTTVVGAPWRELTFVELVTDDGLTGVGEVRMVNKTRTLLACVQELAPRHVLGADPFDLERLAWNLQRAEYGRAGEVAQSALSLFDMACWDLIGQALGVPVWKLLGGRVRDRVPAYANGWYTTAREPDRIAERARAVVELVDQAPAVDPADGCFALPSGPGLGVRLDREACLAHPATGARLELFREGWETRHQEGSAVSARHDDGTTARRRGD
jgi:galactonate dehydratase